MAKAISKAISLQDMHLAAGEACRLLRALAHPDRLMLLCQLTQGEMSVGELEAALGIHQPTLSQQLTVLRDEALVDTRRDGKYVHYRVRKGPALAVVKALYAQFCERRKP